MNKSFVRLFHYVLNQSSIWLIFEVNSADNELQKFFYLQQERAAAYARWLMKNLVMNNHPTSEHSFGGNANFEMFYTLWDAWNWHQRLWMFVQVESNGTVLSTNWKDVGKKKIEGSAPTGMDMKKWEI